MKLKDITTTDFMLIQASWTIKMCLQVINTVESSHVIIYKKDAGEHYYLFTASSLSVLLTPFADTAFLFDVVDAQPYIATPAFESASDAEDAPDQCVVLEDGYPIGFFDASIPPDLGVLRGGEETNTGEDQSDQAVRSLVADFPAQIRLHEVFSVLVLLSAEPLPTMRLSLPVTLSPGTIIDIMLQPRKGLAIEGKAEGQLVIPDQEETLPVQFKLRGTALGPGLLKIFAFHNGQPLGSLSLHITVLNTSDARETQRDSEESPLHPIRVYQPDLSLCIFERSEAGNTTLTFQLTAQDRNLELNLKLYGPVALKMSAQHYFQEFFKEIERLPLRSENHAVIEQKLAARGAYLFTSIFPPELQLLLWSLQDRIQSVQIQSEEQWIPWELCKLCGNENGQDLEGPFLGEAFAVTRWLPQIPLKPLKPRLSLQNMAVVVPAHSLPFAQTEWDYLNSLKSERRQVHAISATFLDVREALASGKYDGWHFTGHGGSREIDKNKAVLYLEKDETLTAEDLCGGVRNLKRSCPIVFLNACCAGRATLELTGVSGWASQFLRAGAGAFIGTYWSVYDKSAYRFAQAVYDRLLVGMPIGRAVQEARRAIKSPLDPSWLAYTVFADPLATVQE